jgi:hypothetical protein
MSGREVLAEARNPAVERREASVSDAQTA